MTVTWFQSRLLHMMCQRHSYWPQLHWNEPQKLPEVAKGCNSCVFLYQIGHPFPAYNTTHFNFHMPCSEMLISNKFITVLARVIKSVPTF